MTNTTIKLRAHHGMCLAFFEGKGYSSGFTIHMQSVLDLFNCNPDLQIEIITDADVICAKCPNCENGCCNTPDLVKKYDSQVLSLCGLTEHTSISWNDFSGIVKKKILAEGKREHICGDCQWNTLCQSKESFSYLIP